MVEYLWGVETVGENSKGVLANGAGVKQLDFFIDKNLVAAQNSIGDA